VLSWRVLPLAVVACQAREVVAPPAPSYVVAPPASAWPLGDAHGRFGRSQAPQLAEAVGIAGDVGEPLALPTVWQVPGGGDARAFVFGKLHDKVAVELVPIDRGRIEWRDTTTCAGPIAGVAADVAVCAGAGGVAALGVDGKPRWKRAAVLLAMTGARVAVAGEGGRLDVLDAATGESRAHVVLPAGVPAESIVAACDGGEVFASLPDGKLARVAGGKLAWSVPVGSVAGIDACSGDAVLVTTPAAAGTALVALARSSGKPGGRIDGVRGYWPARDGSDRIEISTAEGVASWPHDLAGAPAWIDLPALAELLASRGDRRLVRATPNTAALLDRSGVRAYLPLAQLGAALGDDHVLAGSWLGSPAELEHRYRIPPPYPRVLRVPARTAGLALPAELRDLPRELPVDETHAIETTAARPAAAAVAGSALYVASDAGLARFDLAARALVWMRAGSPCGALAPARAVVACVAPDGVHAIRTDGTPAWIWPAAHVDALAAGGDVVLAFAGDRATVLDAHDGHVIEQLASDDGGAMRAVALELAGTTLVVTYERGRVVARVPAAQMLPAWSLEVAGVVRALQPAGDGVLVALDDGDAYRIDARTAHVTALPDIGLAWRAFDDVVAASTAGEPIPPAHMPVAPISIPRPIPRVDSPENPAAIATPWVVPPPGPPAWQLALFELGGGVRARDDFALEAPVVPAGARGPAGSPFVVAYGPGARELLVIDARAGDPVRRVLLPDEGFPFSSFVDGKPLAGVVLPNPLRVVIFPP
jgi:hypothetical protein